MIRNPQLNLRALQVAIESVRGVLFILRECRREKVSAEERQHWADQLKVDKDWIEGLAARGIEQHIVAKNGKTPRQWVLTLLVDIDRAADLAQLYADVLSDQLDFTTEERRLTVIMKRLQEHARLMKFLALLPPTATADPKGKGPADKAKGAGPSKLATALAVLKDHPGWTNKQIATVAGCHEKTLSNNKDFRKARTLIKETGKADLRRAHHHRGTDMDAYEDG